MDRRVKRTHHILSRSFLDLLKTRDFDAISIRDITEAADVAYSTFFRNFESKEALLLSYLLELVDSIEAEIRIQGAMSLREKSRYLVMELFEAVRECPNTFRVMNASPEAQAVLKRFRNRLLAINLEMLKNLALHIRADIPPLDLLMNNAVIQAFGMLEWWIVDNHLQASTATMSRYYETVVLEPLWGILFGEAVVRELIP
jgi:AcrR family transcriptional regulator